MENALQNNSFWSILKNSKTIFLSTRMCIKKGSVNFLNKTALQYHFSKQFSQSNYNGFLSTTLNFVLQHPEFELGLKDPFVFLRLSSGNKYQIYELSFRLSFFSKWPQWLLPFLAIADNSSVKCFKTKRLLDQNDFLNFILADFTNAFWPVSVWLLN